ncbi:MAG: adenylyl-sulfate kinase [Undibacterium sp.]|nr:adenylyl-sulfate kinase [Undibacterium sp.]
MHTNTRTDNQNLAMTYWLTGLSGAGKTTLAQGFANDLRQQGRAVCVLDGDELRQGLSRDLGFSIADREEQARRVAEIARLLNGNGIIALVALISPTKAGREQARQIIGSSQWREIYVSTPLEICRQRDVKGLYAKARNEPTLQLTGVQSSYQVPEYPDCVIDTSQATLEMSLERLRNLSCQGGS